MGIMSKNFVLWIGFHKYFFDFIFCNSKYKWKWCSLVLCKSYNGWSFSYFIYGVSFIFCGEFEFLKNKLIPNAVKRFTSKVFIGGACIVSLIVAIISGGYTKEVNFSVAGNKSYIRSDNYKEGVSTGKIFLVYL